MPKRKVQPKKNGLKRALNRDDNPVSPELVNAYLKDAQEAATTPWEAQALRAIDAPLFEFMLTQAVFRSGDTGISRDLLFVGEIAAGAPVSSSWRDAILQEIHLALCERSSKYAKEVKALGSNGRLLIGAIAGYVAAVIGWSVAVIAALVAALLRLFLIMGVSVFCKMYRTQFAEQESAAIKKSGKRSKKPNSKK
jgi:hypothetical protein